MRHTIGVLLATMVLSTSAALPQTSDDGEITGRIVDAQGVAIPGVLIRIRCGEDLKEAVTDKDGRFAARSLALATYQVRAELAGFLPAAGTIRLSPAIKRAHLVWQLGAGCLEEEVRVILSLREAAPLVDAILHVRVTSAHGPALMSERPECESHVAQEYSAEVLSTARGGRIVVANVQRGTLRVFLFPREARLEPGREYLALLWPNGVAADQLVLPIVSGRLASAPAAGTLAGLRVSEAMETLGRWSKEHPRKPPAAHQPVAADAAPRRG